MMKKYSLIVFSALLLAACGDPSRDAGREAGEIQNNATSAGSVPRNMEDSEDSTGNLHPRQKGSSTPADEKGNY